MATEKTKKFRNLAHVFAGITFSYLVVRLLNINDFPEWQYYILSMILGAFIGLICGLGWDVMIMKFIFGETADAKDIMRTMYGGIFGGIIAMFYKDLLIVFECLAFACLIGMALDIYRALKKE